MAQKIVEIADLKTGGKNDELVTYALGSCVGICTVSYTHLGIMMMLGRNI